VFELAGKNYKAAIRIVLNEENESTYSIDEKKEKSNQTENTKISKMKNLELKRHHI
jgi:hypothetical protein